MSTCENLKVILENESNYILAVFRCSVSKNKWCLMLFRGLRMLAIEILTNSLVGDRDINIKIQYIRVESQDI